MAKKTEVGECSLHGEFFKDAPDSGCPACQDDGLVRFQCENCRKLWMEAQLKPVKDVTERVDPGEVMPAGECPDCGAVCHECKDDEPIESIEPNDRLAIAAYNIRQLQAVGAVEQLRLLQAQVAVAMEALEPGKHKVQIPEPVLTELLEIARRALADGDFFDEIAKSCDLSDDYMLSLRDALDEFMKSEGHVNRLSDLNPALPERIPCADCGIPIQDPGEDCREPEAFLCDTCLKKADPENVPACKLTGAPGENPDDCTTPVITYSREMTPTAKQPHLPAVR